MTRRLAAVLAVLGSVVLCCGGCAFSGLDFRQDTSVVITSPHDRQDVHTPVHISWRVRTPGTAQQLANGASGGYFAVFVDRAPVHPGQSLRAITDPVCQRTPGCPDASDLAQLDVYITRSTSLWLTTLPDLTPAGARPNRLDYLHEVTIILVDSTMHRIGEAAFVIDFFDLPGSPGKAARHG